ncbi:MAG: S8 family serine peptidase, partial [Thermoleophilaceae bacterium]|nr:S8 family serine peptidase [Thermoleophilaceae bacterium]
SPIRDTNFACAIEYAAKNGARIVNASIGGYDSFLEVSRVILEHPNVLFVFPAGDYGLDSEVQPMFPCADASPNVICVAASNNFDQLAPFSGYGKKRVDLAAPGDAIVTAVADGPGSYATSHTTGLSTAYVSGAASLLLYRFPGLSPTEVKAFILNGADRIPSMNCKTVTGGRLNVADSLALAAGTLTKSAPTCRLPGGPPERGDPGPIIKLKAENKSHLASSGALSFSVKCSADCDFTYEIILAKKIGKLKGRGVGFAGKTMKIFARPSKKVRRRLAKALRKGRVRTAIDVTAADTAGNAAEPAHLVMYLRR